MLINDVDFKLMTLWKCHEQLYVVIRYTRLGDIPASMKMKIIQLVYSEVTDSRSYHSDHERAKQFYVS